MNARRTAVRLTFAGVDISTDINKHLLSLTYTDNEEDKTDDLQLSLDDREGVLLETVLNRAKIVPLRDRGENGNTSYALPEDWDEANVKVYCFATLRNGSAASDSRYLTV